MPFVTSEDGVRIHYEVEGEGAPLVLMHGTASNGESWKSRGYVDRLKDHFRCIMVDSRGHGQSDYPREQEAYELRNRVMDIAAVLNDLQVGKAFFLGYSMGGWIGWGITIYMPQRFHALAIGGFGPATDPYFGKSIQELLGARWNKLADEDQEVLPLVFAETARFGGARQALKTTKLPLLLYAGDQDPRFPAVLGAGQLGPTATFFQLPGKDHAQASRDADAVETISAKVVEFFAGVPTEA